MTKQERLREIIDEIWEVEQELPDESLERKYLYKARIEIMNSIATLNK